VLVVVFTALVRHGMLAPFPLRLHNGHGLAVSRIPWSQAAVLQITGLAAKVIARWCFTAMPLGGDPWTGLKRRQRLEQQS